MFVDFREREERREGGKERAHEQWAASHTHPDRGSNAT